ncbi:MAG: S9 family peptidase [Syntrophales bacterium]|nr:S9 family peptidase [Syntrophales bacterium]
MSKLIRCLVPMVILIFLSACFGDSSSSKVVAENAPTEDVNVALAMAMAANPALAVQILPFAHLDPLDNQPGSAPKAILGVSRVASYDPVVGDPLDIAVADLQSSYETMFCQLNSTYGVTLQSPQCQANISFIRQQDGTGFFDLTKKPILNNPLGVTAVKFQKITYTTNVSLPQGNRSFQVSGGLMMPQGIAGGQLKGVVVYFHGTSFNKSMVGSNYVTNGETRLNAQVFASQGYIVLIPDYVGQGDDWQDVHPYVLYPRVSVKTAIDMLAAVAPLIKAQYQLSDDSVLKLFSAGYSEGGAYSLWFAIILNDNPSILPNLYQFKHAVGMEGAYNTSVVTKGFLFDDVGLANNNPYNIQQQVLTNVVKPLLSADAFLSYATYQLNGDTASVFNPDFYAMKCKSTQQSACNVNGSNLTIGEAFAQPDTMIANQLLMSALKQSANGATYPVDLVLSYHNSVKALVTDTFFSDASQAQLYTVLQAADVNLANMPDKSVSIISLDKDSVVSPNNFTKLKDTYPSKIRYAYMLEDTKIQVVSALRYQVGNKPLYVNVDHLQALVFEFLYALNIFNQF